MNLLLDDITQIFNSLELTNWVVSGNAKQGGQSKIVEVERITDGKQGVFRYLKRREIIDIKRFEREVGLLVREEYRSKNVVNILDYSLENCWYISEKGQSFTQYWDKVEKELKDKPDSLIEKSILIINELCNGLIKLHEADIVHRDIKPDNIIVIEDSPILIDFGVVYIPDEERITNVDEAVGNQRYSPDQMMNRMNHVPTWLDVFQLSQVLIWMTSIKTVKNWSRPLDWRWVLYSNVASNKLVLSIRALTAICSDELTSPKNSSELKSLLSNLFFNQSNQETMSDSAKQILNKIAEGKSKSLLLASEDLAVFSSTFPLFSVFVNQLIDRARNVFNEFKNDFPLLFNEGKSLKLWEDSIKKSGKMKEHQTVTFFELICGEGKNSFKIECSATFWVPSLMEVKGITVITKDFLPFNVYLNLCSENELFNQRRKNQNLFICLKPNSEIWTSRFQEEFKDGKKLTELVTILNKFQEWTLDPESWELVNI